MDNTTITQNKNEIIRTFYFEHHKGISYRSHLDELEDEAIFILREVAGQFQRPALLFSGGKDSITLVRLSEKAFRPARFPYPLVHIDTGHNFPEVIEFRDNLIKKIKEKLIIGSVEDSIKRGTAKEEKGKWASRNALQSITLLETIEKYEFDACIGGARRDEEKARAKERIFSYRNEFGEWNPKNQRPELWNLYNGKIFPGENIRVFPISNWTELDVWNYIKKENLEIPSIYFAHERDCVYRKDLLFPVSSFVQLDNEPIVRKKVRFRTVGDMTCTAAIESNATTVDDIIKEIIESNTTERGARLDDKRSETAMEDRKKGGYF
jgi:sulfate adenylyltransferase subunit 2